MNIKVFASGSGGNCVLLSERDTHVLIDAGISMRRLQQSLRACDLEIDDIGGVLITHEHSDHVSGLKMLLKYHELPLYAPHTVASRLCGMLPDAEEAMHVIRPGEGFRLGLSKCAPSIRPMTRMRAWAIASKETASLRLPPIWAM